MAATAHSTVLSLTHTRNHILKFLDVPTRLVCLDVCLQWASSRTVTDIWQDTTLYLHNMPPISFFTNPGSVIHFLTQVTELHIDIPSQPVIWSSSEDELRRATAVLTLPDLISSSLLAPRLTTINFHHTFNTAFMTTVTRGIVSIDVEAMLNIKYSLRGRIWDPNTGWWSESHLFRAMILSCTSLTTLDISGAWYQHVFTDLSASHTLSTLTAHDSLLSEAFLSIHIPKPDDEDALDEGEGAYVEYDSSFMGQPPAPSPFLTIHTADFTQTILLGQLHRDIIQHVIVELQDMLDRPQPYYDDETLAESDLHYISYSLPFIRAEPGELDLDTAISSLRLIAFHAFTHMIALDSVMAGGSNHNLLRDLTLDGTAIDTHIDSILPRCPQLSRLSIRGCIDMTEGTTITSSTTVGDIAHPGGYNLLDRFENSTQCLLEIDDDADDAHDADDYDDDDA